MQLTDARVSERPLFSERDRWFESAFLQQRVCKPPVPLGRGAEPEMASLIVKVRYARNQPLPARRQPLNQKQQGDRREFHRHRVQLNLLCNRPSVVAKASKQALIRELPTPSFLADVK